MIEVVAAVIWENGRFLACRRPKDKARALLWEFAGGKVEPGETHEQALVRECKEELGITVEPKSVFREVTHEYPDITIHLTVFDSVIIRGEPAAIEHSEIRWLLPQEAADYEFCPADEEILAAITEGQR